MAEEKKVKAPGGPGGRVQTAESLPASDDEPADVRWCISSPPDHHPGAAWPVCQSHKSAGADSGVRWQSSVFHH